jgi:S-adenosylmethionine synthetase
VSGRSLFTSESVTEGHPDKMADQISDAILDAILPRTPGAASRARRSSPPGRSWSRARSPRTYVDIPRVVRDTVLSIGYDSADVGFDGNTCGVSVAIDEQSPTSPRASTRLRVRRRGRTPTASRAPATRG